MSWELVKLGELITESRILSENPDPDRRITVRLNVLGVEKRPLENEKAGATKQFMRKAGQFIYGKQNFHKGAFGIIPDELDGFESSADLPSFDVREDCLPEWIYFFFKQGGFYLELAKIARGVATQRIHPEQIYDLEIPLPEIETQKSIIASINAIEEKGERLKKEISFQLTQLENLNQAILQEAVQGKLVKQDPKDEPASELLKRIKAEKMNSSDPLGRRKKEKPLPPIKPSDIPFEIPENWVWCRLGEITQFVSGNNFESTDFYKGDGVKCIKITNAGVNEIIETDDVLPIKFLEKYKQFLVFEGDLVLALTRPYISTGLKISICPKSYNKSLLNQRVAVIRALEEVSSEYVYRFLSSIIVLKKYKSMFEGQGQQPNLKKEDVTTLLFPLPPLSEQKRIVAEIEKQLAKTRQLKEHIIANQQATEQLLKALLHQAFEVREMEEVNS